MTIKSLALAALLSTVAATSFAQGPATNTAAPTTNAAPGTMAASASTGAKAMHGDKAAHKAGAKHEMKKSNNTAAPASAATK